MLANGDDRVAEHLVLGLLLEGVQGAEHRHARFNERGELAREDGYRPEVDALEALEDALELHRLALLGDIQDDQPALAKLLGDDGLGRGVHLAASGDAGEVHGAEGESAHRAAPFPTPPPGPRSYHPPHPGAASAPPAPRRAVRRALG